MLSPTRLSYGFILATLGLVGLLHLGTPLLVAMLAYLALDKLQVAHSKWLAVLLFVLLVLAASFALGRFTTQAVVALPAVAEKAIPSLIDSAKAHHIELPFTDWESLKTVTLHTARVQIRYLGRVAGGATRELVYVLLGIVVAVLLFLRPGIEHDPDPLAVPHNLYVLATEAIAARFRLFYASFVNVMGAQIAIAAINTVLTSIFVLAARLPNAAVIVGVTFLCGLLPLVGNLISNTVIAAIAFTVSPRAALMALAFLVLIHKLEYFLNSKIVGDRIRNPVWLTLLALVLGETLMGIPGMILAPVVLGYVKMEASRIEVPETRPNSR